LPLENKNPSKIENVKNAFLIKIIKNEKTFFTSQTRRTCRADRQNAENVIIPETCR